MLRAMHRSFGLAGAAFGVALAISGTILSLEPLTEAARTGSMSTVADVSVAQIAEAATGQIQGVERIEKTANHTLWIHFSDAAGFGKVAFDPITLVPIPTGQASPFMSAVKSFHRSLFLGDVGRAVTGLTALTMLMLTATGLAMLVRRMGGWRALASPPKSGKIQSYHLDLGRIAAMGLLIAGGTGLWLSLASFEVLPTGAAAFPRFPTIDGTQPALPIGTLLALKNTPLAELRELVLPYPDDPTDAILLTTHLGAGYIDPTTGRLVEYAAHSLASRIYEVVYLLHTGQGAWLVGIVLGLLMLAVPGVIATGVIMALRRPKTGKRRIKSVPSHRADTIVLVGSEGATTWGFAGELSRKLTRAGRRVHVADLNDVSRQYPAGKHLFILTATYGQGQAPSNAVKFLGRIKHLRSDQLAFAALGFGDRSFPQFCAFADAVQTACRESGLKPLLDYTPIDRQSSQAFQAWGRRVGAALGIDLDLDHTVQSPPLTRVTLRDRIDYGQEVQAPVSILRLTAMHGRVPHHEPGDLLGVLVPGSAVPRFYSLASSQRDNCVEICVRRQNGGLCSGILTGLNKGDCVDVFIKPNPEFRPNKSRRPLVLIGAGAGIGPLIGFARANQPQRDATLFWGGRDPASDYLYQDELVSLTKSGQLRQVTTAFSRCVDGTYIQEKLAASAQELRRAIQRGGQVMVCGGAVMGNDVRQVWDDILAPIGLSVEQLKREKRYLEDVY